MADSERQQNGGEKHNRAALLKLLLGRISCVVGLLFGVGAVVVALSAESMDISGGW